MKKFNQTRMQICTKFYKTTGAKFTINTKKNPAFKRPVEIGWYIAGFLVILAALIIAFK